MVVVDRRAAYEALVLRVVEPMRRYALRRGERDEAEDVLADALLVLWRRFDDVPTDDPLPWCYGVMRLCQANAARARRRQWLLGERLRFVHPRGAEDVDLGDPGLEVAMGQLRDEDRELLRLWAWEDLAPQQIARVLGITTNAAAIRLHRAKERLAKNLVGEVPGVARNSGDPAGQREAEDTEAGP